MLSKNKLFMNENHLHDIRSFLSHLKISFSCQRALEFHTTFRIGGPCPLLIHCAATDHLIAVIRYLAQHNIDYLVIGDGSNILVSDTGTAMVMVHCVSGTPQIIRQSNQLRVTASTRFDDLVQYTVANGIDKFFNCSGIPGTVGGAIAGNAGAFGWQIADALIGLQIIDRQGELRTVSMRDLGFRYRHSDIGNLGYTILNAVFAVATADHHDITRERQRILALRRQKHPDVNVIPTAGSFFKNIEPTSQAERRQAAGYFLELAGAKDMRVGGAAVFTKHANIIVRNSPDCTAQDIADLSVMMSQAVRNKFGIELQREVKLVGKFDE